MLIWSKNIYAISFMNLQQAVKSHQIFGNVTPVFGKIFRVFNEKNRPLLIRMKTFFLVVSKTI